MDQLQFYPTPPNLARRAWKKFRDTDFARVLEPSAGNGDLAMACPHNDGYGGGRGVRPDCIEVDISKHPTLQGNHLKVVGYDFMQFRSGAIYSHFIMNPPFAQGALHVLHAWQLAWDAEIVAILNAETIRNPFSKERQMLVKLIEEHGEVEFIEGAFTVEEAERKTSVDVALVWLKKKADVSNDLVGTIMDDLKRDGMTAESLAGDYREGEQLAIPNSTIENAVLAFNAAVRAMREAVTVEARAQYYERLLGETMATRNGDAEGSTYTSVNFIRKNIAERYDELKDRAWAGIIRSANVTSKLSSTAQKRVEAEFEKIKQLEFSVNTIYGFLCGIVESQGDLQIQMILDCFDAISRYHTDNAHFYRGWRSNDRHRTAGMRIKTTRFVLPHHNTESYHSSFRWETEQLLKDFDKVFAMLDGKQLPTFGLHDASRAYFKDLRDGKRVSSDYFDLRYYKGIGTLHFFPKKKELVDRLNRVVGARRKWLPPEGEKVSDAFWLQYDTAEKFDKELRAEVAKNNTNRWRDPFWQLTCRDGDEKQQAADAIDTAMETVLEKHGIHVDFQIADQSNTTNQQGQLLLAAA